MQEIQLESTFLGIELGSTRIKAVLIDEAGNSLASGDYEWENQLLDGIWTYDLGHGGFFKTKEVGQKMLAAAIEAPVSVMETAGEGGAWGIALLASYMKNKEEEKGLDDYLEHKIFKDKTGSVIFPDAMDVAGFEKFMEQYRKGLGIERAAVDYF